MIYWKECPDCNGKSEWCGRPLYHCVTCNSNGKIQVEGRDPSKFKDGERVFWADADLRMPNEDEYDIEHGEFKYRVKCSSVFKTYSIAPS